MICGCRDFTFRLFSEFGEIGLGNEAGQDAQTPANDLFLIGGRPRFSTQWLLRLCPVDAKPVASTRKMSYSLGASVHAFYDCLESNKCPYANTTAFVSVSITNPKMFAEL